MVKNNSFYIKQEIDSTSAIKLSALFKDAALYENDIMTLESGPAAAKFLASGSIPANPVYGEGDLTGAKLVLFCSFFAESIFELWASRLSRTPQPPPPRHGIAPGAPRCTLLPPTPPGCRARKRCRPARARA